MVTLVGSPPKAVMYFCTQRKARRSAGNYEVVDEDIWGYRATTYDLAIQDFPLQRLSPPFHQGTQKR